MNRLLILLLSFMVAGCASPVPRPTSAAYSYPDASPATIDAAAYLRFEGLDFGLDGGSAVYILSTPDKQKVALWNRCAWVKDQLGCDPKRNLFMLQTGFGRVNEHSVDQGTELERKLIEKLKASIREKEAFPGQHRCEARIIAGLRDRSHRVDL